MPKRLGRPKGLKNPAPLTRRVFANAEKKLSKRLNLAGGHEPQETFDFGKKMAAAIILHNLTYYIWPNKMTLLPDYQESIEFLQEQTTIETLIELGIRPARIKETYSKIGLTCPLGQL